MQIRLTVDYLKALAAKRDVRSDEGEVEYYNNKFDNVEAELVKMRRLTWYNSVTNLPCTPGMEGYVSC